MAKLLVCLLKEASKTKPKPRTHLIVAISKNKNKEGAFWVIKSHLLWYDLKKLHHLIKAGISLKVLFVIEFQSWKQ